MHSNVYFIFFLCAHRQHVRVRVKNIFFVSYLYRLYIYKKGYTLWKKARDCAFVARVHGNRFALSCNLYGLFTVFQKPKPMMVSSTFIVKTQRQLKWRRREKIISRSSCRYFSSLRAKKKWRGNFLFLRKQNTHLDPNLWWIYPLRALVHVLVRQSVSQNNHPLAKLLCVYQIKIIFILFAFFSLYFFLVELYENK